MIYSMTGYGNYSCENDQISFLMELKSVNSKHYESNLKLPYVFSNQEEKIDSILKKNLYRGRIIFNLSYKIKDSNIYSLSLDKSKLKNYLEILEELKATSNIDDKISYETNVKGRMTHWDAFKHDDDFKELISEFFNTSIALIVISSRFPIGVETIYKVLVNGFIL